MKGFMHKDPLNLTGEYDTTEYKKLIPKVEIPKNHKHQNVNRHKQKMKAKRLRKNESGNVPGVLLQQSITNLFERLIELYKEQKRVEKQLEAHLHLHGHIKPQFKQMCQICNKYITAKNFQRHLLDSHKRRGCFKCNCLLSLECKENICNRCSSLKTKKSSK